MTKRLFLDLVGPVGSGGGDGKKKNMDNVDELRVAMHYDAQTKTLFHMEYIDVAFGESWLEHPWLCEWKYRETFR